MSIVRVDAGPDTVHWGYFEAGLKPVATIASGEQVVLASVSGTADLMPPPPTKIPPALSALHNSSVRRVIPGHILTGPVAVRGAKAGSVLQVDIEDIGFNYDWGYSIVRPLAGALPYDFDKGQVTHISLDLEKNVGRLPWGMEVPLKPFFGIMAVAPPAAWGTISTLPPRPNGGNLDNKELVAGTTLYLPVFVDGALFSAGDGHGAQGDGEVSINAIETGLVGTFRLTARDDMSLKWPMAETPTHMMTMAFDPDLDDCVVIALRSMIDLIVARTGISRANAYTLCSLAADLRITQVVNGSKGVHVMLEKRYLTKA
jgi:acetamidase/formamidase